MLPSTGEAILLLNGCEQYPTIELGMDSDFPNRFDFTSQGFSSILDSICSTFMHEVVSYMEYAQMALVEVPEYI